MKYKSGGIMQINEAIDVLTEISRQFEYSVQSTDEDAVEAFDSNVKCVEALNLAIKVLRQQRQRVETKQNTNIECNPVIKAAITVLTKAFPRGRVNDAMEFIADPTVNTYFRLEDCTTLLDVQCKVLALLSRAAFKSQWFDSDFRNEKMHAYHLDGINNFLGTDFSKSDMKEIYTHLGNDVNREKTIEFIKSGYDMTVLRGDE